MNESPRDLRLDDELRRFLDWQSADLASVPTTEEMIQRLSAGNSRSLRVLPIRRLIPALLMLVLLASMLATGLFLGRPPAPHLIPTIDLRLFSYATDGYEIGLPRGWTEEDNEEFRGVARWRGVRTFRGPVNGQQRLAYISFGDVGGRVGLPVEIAGTTGVGEAQLTSPISDATFGSLLGTLYREVTSEAITLDGESARMVLAEGVAIHVRAWYVLALHAGRPMIIRFLVAGDLAQRAYLDQILASFRFTDDVP